MAEEPDTTTTSLSGVHSPKTTEGEFSEAPTDSEVADVEHSEEEDDDDEDATEHLVNPSKNIKEDLKRILAQNGTKNAGSFSSSKSYANAPNPGLNLEAMGVIGLPLSETAAKHLISGCSQAPFGKGERTIVDKSVRDTWEMDASKVIFENPAWAEWIESQVIPEVCEALGVGLAAAKPRVELYKLLVYETGSHFLPHQDTEKTPGMFATIVIILPSKFTGGSLQLSHAGESKKVDMSAQSGFATHVAAWYTDVFHSINPIQSGYRVALSYNLIHTNAPSLKPALSDMGAEAQELKHVLLSWNQSDSPERLLYLLDHMYSESNLQFSLLKGKDQQLVARIRGIAERLRIRICLVTLELHQRGGANDWGDCDYEDVEMVEVEESDLSLTCAYDLNGKKVELYEDLDLDDGDCIPYDLSKTEPADQEYEGYQGNYGGNIDLWYRRTALLIWPQKFDATIAQRNYVQEVRETLQVVRSKSPSNREMRLIHEVIKWLQDEAEEEEMEEVVSIVTSAGLRWKDTGIWVDTCKAARVDFRMIGMTVDQVINGVDELGFEAIKDFLEDVMKNNTSDQVRLNLLHYLRYTGSGEGNKEKELWVNTWEHQILRSLRGLDAEAATTLVLAIKRSSNSKVTLQDIIMPQITSLKPPKAFLVAFETALRSHDLAPPEVAKYLLSLAVSQAEVFPKQVAPKGKTDAKADIASWIQTLQIAANTDTLLIKAFCQRTANSWIQQSAKAQDWLAKEFFPVAILRLQSWCQSQSPPILPGNDSLSPFWETAVRCFLPRMDRFYNQFVLALGWCGGVDAMRAELMAYLKQFFTNNPSHGEQRVLQIYNASKSATTMNNTLHAKLLDIATEAFANYFPLVFLTKGPGDIKTMKSVMLALSACGVESSIKLYLERLSQLTPREVTAHDYIHHYLLPFIIEVTPSYRLESPTGPLSEFVVRSLNRAVTLLGPMPATNISVSELRSLGCGCQDCQALPRFAESELPSIFITATQKIRTHIERQLNGKAGRMGFTWETRRFGSPHSLVVTKPPALIKQRQWPSDRDKVIQAMNSIGPISAQKQVLDAKWPDFCKTLLLNPLAVQPHKLGMNNAILPGTQPASNSMPVVAFGVNGSIATVPRTSQPAAKQVSATVVGPSSSTTAKTTLPKAAVQSSKRPFEQAMGGQASSSSAPIPKRSKPSKASLEIIELSD